MQKKFAFFQTSSRFSWTGGVTPFLFLFFRFWGSGKLTHPLFGGLGRGDGRGVGGSPFPSEDSPVMYLLANFGFDTAENEPSKILATSDVAQTITEYSLITIQANIDERNAIMRVSTQYISTMIGTYQKVTIFTRTQQYEFQHIRMKSKGSDKSELKNGHQACRD